MNLNKNTQIEIDLVLERLGITRSMCAECKLPPFQDSTQLIDAGLDMFGRPQQMTPGTFSGWQRLTAAADKAGITLQLVSAYRSFEYQCRLIQEKLDAGRSIEDILKVNAIPGHSEHHTGCAIDLHAGEGEPLDEHFDQNPAFGWLTQHAAQHNFYLSYPKNGTLGIAYEPWHWCYRD